MFEALAEASGNVLMVFMVLLPFSSENPRADTRGRGNTAHIKFNTNRDIPACLEEAELNCPVAGRHRPAAESRKIPALLTTGGPRKRICRALTASATA